MRFSDRSQRHARGAGEVPGRRVREGDDDPVDAGVERYRPGAVDEHRKRGRRVRRHGEGPAGGGRSQAGALRVGLADERLCRQLRAHAPSQLRIEIRPHGDRARAADVGRRHRERTDAIRPRYVDDPGVAHDCSQGDDVGLRRALIGEQQRVGAGHDRRRGGVGTVEGQADLRGREDPD